MRNVSTNEKYVQNTFESADFLENDISLSRPKTKVYSPEINKV